jgi:hypothetical protein
MKHRTLDIECDAATACRLAEAIRAYALAAYPDGGSECAQAARQALLDTAAGCESHTGDRLAVRRRQLPMLRAAVRWWLDEFGSGKTAVGADLASALNIRTGEPYGTNP